MEAKLHSFSPFDLVPALYQSQQVRSVHPKTVITLSTEDDVIIHPSSSDDALTLLVNTGLSRHEAKWLLHPVDQDSSEDPWSRALVEATRAESLLSNR